MHYVAASFDPSDGIAFAEVDCSIHTNLFIAANYEVKSYPQIRFAPINTAGYEFFNSEMSAEALVAFANQRIGTNRTSALVVSVDRILTSVDGPDGYDTSFLARLEKETKKHPYHPSMPVYLELGRRVVEEGVSVVRTEREQLDALIADGDVGFHKKRGLITRRNILNKFVVN